MKINYKPKSQLEKFGYKVYHHLVENFPQTFFAGGVARDLLLHRKVIDIDIATSATPDEVVRLLKRNKIAYTDQHRNFGVIIAKSGAVSVEIATFRREVYSDGRYPKVTFTTNVADDSKRRDFTINALYFKPENGKAADYHQGLEDLKDGALRFIGQPLQKILEDPLRIIRLLRFALDLNFSVEKKSYKVIKKYFDEVKKITSSRLRYELNKVKSQKNKKIILKVINSPKLLDKYFKSL